MSKKIIHQKFQMNKSYISREQIHKFHDYLKSNLGDEYVVITSPFDIACIDGDAKIIQIAAQEYSYNELMEAIEKADMYDGLCH